MQPQLAANANWWSTKSKMPLPNLTQCNLFCQIAPAPKMKLNWPALRFPMQFLLASCQLHLNDSNIAVSCSQCLASHPDIHWANRNVFAKGFPSSATRKLRNRSCSFEQTTDQHVNELAASSLEVQNEASGTPLQLSENSTGFLLPMSRNALRNLQTGKTIHQQILYPLR